MTAGRRTLGGRGGFMMVEALSALALGALILVALLALTGMMRRSADKAARGVEFAEISNRTVDTIAREIRRASRARWAVQPAQAGAQITTQAKSSTAQQQPQQQSSRTADLRQPDGDGQQSDGDQSQGAGDQVQPRPFVFSGAPDRVSFALTPRQETGLRAPVFVAYQVDDAGAVLRAEAPLRADAMAAAGLELGPVERIEPGPERFRFAYVQRLPGGAGEAIVDNWADPLTMPVAIRIDRFDAGTGQQTGSLRVPLLVSAEPGCAAQKSALCSRVEASSSGQDAAAPDGQPPTPPQGASGAQR